MPDGCKGILDQLQESVQNRVEAIGRALDEWLTRDDLDGFPVNLWAEEQAEQEKTGEGREPQSPEQVQDPEVAEQGQRLHDHDVTHEGAPQNDLGQLNPEDGRPKTLWEEDKAQTIQHGRDLRERGVTYEQDVPENDLGEFSPPSQVQGMDYE